MAKQKGPSASLVANDFASSVASRHFLGDFFLWDGAIYRKLPAGEIEHLAFNHVIQYCVARGVTHLGATALADPNLVRDITESLKHQTFLNPSLLPPFIMPNQPANVVVCQNGVLNIDLLLANNPTAFGPHNSSLFATVKLPFDYDPNATCPKWEEFVQWMVGDNIFVASLLQEYIGWGFINLRLEKELFLVGRGRNGKSVFLSTIHRLVGDGGASTIPLERFGERFSLIQTLGRHFNLVADAEEVNKLQEGKIKAFVSEDPDFVEEKYKPGFVARPRARLIVCCNSLPHFTDKSDGTWRRLLIVPCDEVPLVENPQLGDELAKELPGILNWALEGAQRLLANKRFDVPKAITDEVYRARISKNPTRQFIQESLVADPEGQSVTRDLLAKTYHAWMDDLKYHPLAFNNLLQEIKREFGPLGQHVKERRLGARQKRYWVVAGIKWIELDIDNPETVYKLKPRAGQQAADSQSPDASDFMAGVLDSQPTPTGDSPQELTPAAVVPQEVGAAASAAPEPDSEYGPLEALRDSLPGGI